MNGELNFSIFPFFPERFDKPLSGLLFSFLNSTQQSSNQVTYISQTQDKILIKIIEEKKNIKGKNAVV